MKQSAFGSAVALLEDALVLVKQADSTAWFIYAAGAVPFFALLLFEATDLAQNPFALERLALLAFVLAALYIWLHICQSMFAARLHAILTASHARFEFRQSLAMQALLAPAKLIVWPLGLLTVIPHATVTMFYQHALIPGQSRTGTIAEAKCDAAYRRTQSVWLLLLVFLLRLIFWFNLLLLTATLPSLIKTFTGIEGKLTRSPGLLLNPTAFVALCALAYLALDPAVKACCVLRRFARQSETSGLDLRLRLSKLQRISATAVVGLVFCAPLHMRAASASNAPAVSPQEMQRAIGAVFHDPRNSWDLPVVEQRKPASNAFVAFMDSIVDRIDAFWKSINSAIDDFFRALQRLFSRTQRPSDGEPKPVSKSVGWIVIGSFSLLLAAALVLALRKRQRRSRPQFARTTLVAAKPIDLAHEDTSALDQPADEWLKLAAQYRDGGNLRLALRALYLAMLALLGRQGLISLAPGKSNLDFLRELDRRARRLSPEFVPAFGANLRFFEESWYGEHPVTEETLARFERNFTLLRAAC